MKTYLINLAHRTDRLREITDQLDARDMTFTRIEAVDGTGDDDIGYPKNHPNLTKGEFACYLSHVEIWKRFITSGDPLCLILEDDVALSPSFSKVLSTPAFFSTDHGSVRFETFPHKVSLRHRPTHQAHGFATHLAKQYRGSSGAYVIKRAYAEYLLAHHSVPDIPVDERLFHPGRSRFSNNTPLHLVPAIAIQKAYLKPEAQTSTAQSDLTAHRNQNPPAKSPFRFFPKLMRNLQNLVTDNIHIGNFGRIRIFIPYEGGALPHAAAMPVDTDKPPKLLTKTAHPRP